MKNHSFSYAFKNFKKSNLLFSIISFFVLIFLINSYLYAVLFWLFLIVFLHLQCHLLEKNLVKILSIERKDKTASWVTQNEEKDLVCKQVYHDLASPLGLLKISTTKLEDQNIAKPFALSIDRLNKICDNLKAQKYIWASNNMDVVPLKTVIQNAITENRDLLLANLDLYISKDLLEKVVDIPVYQLQRALSSIFETIQYSIHQKDQVKLTARMASQFLDLCITHPGKDVSDDFFWSKNCLEAFGGRLIRLKTKKERKHGAAFLLRLPLVKDSI